MKFVTIHGHMNGEKEVYFIFLTCYITSDFPQNDTYLTILSFSVQIPHLS